MEYSSKECRLIQSYPQLTKYFPRQYESGRASWKNSCATAFFSPVSALVARRGKRR